MMTPAEEAAFIDEAREQMARLERLAERLAATARDNADGAVGDGDRTVAHVDHPAA